jgi:Two component regulator propeller
MPSAVAQTADGYIWIGTDAGLFKFDGMRFVRWNAQSGEVLPSSSISSLLGAQDGSLWIGTDAGLAQVAPNRLILYEKGWGIGHTIIEDKGGQSDSADIELMTGNVLFVRWLGTT